MEEDQEVFGSLKFYRKNGKLTKPYPLSVGTTTIGSSEDANIRLRIPEKELEPIHCIVEVNPEGLAIVINKSKSWPVVVNKTPEELFRVLNHLDEFEVVGKKFQYFNENVSKKEVKILQKIMEDALFRPSTNLVSSCEKDKSKTANKKTGAKSSTDEFAVNITPDHKPSLTNFIEKCKSTSKIIVEKALDYGPDVKRKRLTMGGKPSRRSLKISSKNILLNEETVKEMQEVDQIEAGSSKEKKSINLIDFSEEEPSAPSEEKTEQKQSPLTKKRVSRAKSMVVVKTDQSREKTSLSKSLNIVEVTKSPQNVRLSKSLDRGRKSTPRLSRKQSQLSEAPSSPLKTPDCTPSQKSRAGNRSLLKRAIDNSRAVKQDDNSVSVYSISSSVTDISQTETDSKADYQSIDNSVASIDNFSTPKDKKSSKASFGDNLTPIRSAKRNAEKLKLLKEKNLTPLIESPLTYSIISIDSDTSCNESDVKNKSKNPASFASSDKENRLSVSKSGKALDIEAENSSEVLPRKSTRRSTNKNESAVSLKNISNTVYVEEKSSVLTLESSKDLDISKENENEVSLSTTGETVRRSSRSSIRRSSQVELNSSVTTQEQITVAETSNAEETQDNEVDTEEISSSLRRSRRTVQIETEHEQVTDDNSKLLETSEKDQSESEVSKSARKSKGLKKDASLDTFEDTFNMSNIKSLNSTRAINEEIEKIEALVFNSFEEAVSELSEKDLSRRSNRKSKSILKTDDEPEKKLVRKSLRVSLPVVEENNANTNDDGILDESTKSVNKSTRRTSLRASTVKDQADDIEGSVKESDKVDQIAETAVTPQNEVKTIIPTFRKSERKSYSKLEPDSSETVSSSATTPANNNEPEEVAEENVTPKVHPTSSMRNSVRKSLKMGNATNTMENSNLDIIIESTPKLLSPKSPAIAVSRSSVRKSLKMAATSTPPKKTEEKTFKTPSNSKNLFDSLKKSSRSSRIQRIVSSAKNEDLNEKKRGREYSEGGRSLKKKKTDQSLNKSISSKNSSMISLLGDVNVTDISSTTCSSFVYQGADNTVNESISEACIASNMSGIEQLTPVQDSKPKTKNPKTPKNDLTNIPNLKKFLSPKPAVSPKNDLSDVKGVKALLKTPKVVKTPKNDLRNVPNLRNLMSPKEKASPKNDLTDVKGVKALLKTPKIVKTPKNDLRNVPNLRKLMSPKENSSPKNDLTDVRGVKALLKTPKVMKTPKNDLTNIPNLKKFVSPKQYATPKNDLTNVAGVKKLLTTPKEVKSPLNDLRNVRGIRKLLSTPKAMSTPKNDLTNIPNLRAFMSPKVPKEPKNDLSDVEGVEDLFTSRAEKLFDELVEKPKLRTYKKRDSKVNEEGQEVEGNDVDTNRIQEWLNDQEDASVEELDNEHEKQEVKSSAQKGKRGRKGGKEEEIVEQKSDDQEATPPKRSRRGKKNEENTEEIPTSNQRKTRKAAEVKPEENAPKKRATRRKVLENIDAFADEEPQEQPVEVKPKRTRKAKVEENNEVQEQVEVKPAKRGRKAKEEEAVTEKEEQIEVKTRRGKKVKESTESNATVEETETKPTRKGKNVKGTKGTVEENEEHEDQTKSKPRRGKKVKEDEIVAEDKEEQAQVKSMRGKKVKDDEIVAEDKEDEEQAQVKTKRGKKVKEDEIVAEDKEDEEQAQVKSKRGKKVKENKVEEKIAEEEEETAKGKTTKRKKADDSESKKKSVRFEKEYKNEEVDDSKKKKSKVEEEPIRRSKRLRK